MSEWQPIETEPKIDGTLVLCCWAGEPDSESWLRWKTNYRIVEAHKQGQGLEYLASYYGDPSEWDDYDLAKPGAGPTHWLPRPSVPLAHNAVKRD